MVNLSRGILKNIDDAVKAFEEKRSDFESDASILQTRLLTNAQLKKLIHSSKGRAKDPTHLRDKLIRKATEAAGARKQFAITRENLFDRIADLAGVRLLHLHMQQMKDIHPLILKVLDDEGFVLEGKPEAKTWDPEYAEMLKELGLKVLPFAPTFYTSVHYVIKMNKKTARLCELQVRTLAEEIWGEISHTINYPHETDSVACREQLKVLARIVSGCSRLVDSIVTSHADHCSRPRRRQRRGTRSR